MSKNVRIELQPIEATALMVMLESEINRVFDGGLDLNNWETLDLDAYQLLAYHTYKTLYEAWCEENDT